ncbi:site-specific DNA methylase [Moraxella macacae 0408225]|uniref:DNA (cytosine-5-)-methyltransferase n=1 Tax=Moraxella macacae 0408225 TaxID=1230338 RepID=L2F8U2_9GAMM|nr:DNA cytosine methyltransferase [Moraxella macacae]ELA09325.1 site-specific DNA methylase [Moraxella macacae 0408225]
MTKQYTLFETFVGAGGSHIGFKQNGFKSVYVNDCNKDCIATLLLNNPEIKDTAFIDCQSILDIDIDNLLTNINLKQGELDVMFGGIVCKGFSLAGERSPNDERNYFYHQQLKLVATVKPKLSIIENVKAFSNGKVLAQHTPQNIKDEVDRTWQALENYKGQKAELRKKNKLSAEFLQYGAQLRKEKEALLKILTENNYLISVLDDLYQIYEQIGYNVAHKILNSAWYGAATKRERIIIVAVRKDLPNNFEFPLPIYHSNEITTKLDFNNSSEKKFLTPITIGQVLAQIDYKNKNDIDNIPMKHAPKTIERFKYIKAGENIQATMHEIPDELKISSFYSRGNTMRLAMDLLAPTLVPGHSNFPVHPIEHRSITVREAAVITGFPLDYQFVGNHSKRCEHVGNAVPPPLANAIAKQCVKFLNQFS